MDVYEQISSHEGIRFHESMYCETIANASDIDKVVCSPQVLHEHGFPVPKPIDQARHCLVMELIDAFPL